jgi:hypothetical protein
VTAIARLAAVSLDSADPAGLAAFYRQLRDPAGHPFCTTTLIPDV